MHQETKIKMKINTASGMCRKAYTGKIYNLKQKVAYCISRPS